MSLLCLRTHKVASINPTPGPQIEKHGKSNIDSRKPRSSPENQIPYNPHPPSLQTTFDLLIFLENFSPRATRLKNKLESGEKMKMKIL